MYIIVSIKISLEGLRLDGHPGGNIANPLASENYSYPVNSDSSVKAIGWGVEFDYQLGQGFNVRVNFSGDQLRDVPDGLLHFSIHRNSAIILALANDALLNQPGVSTCVWRWQDEVNWEGTFGAGSIDSYGTLDAQISYKFPKIKSIAKIGGSNLSE